MKAQIGKIYADFADTGNTEKVLTMWTGRPAFNSMTGKKTSDYEVIMYVPDSGWEISNSGDQEVRATWKPSSEFIRESIKSLFEKGIFRL